MIIDQSPLDFEVRRVFDSDFKPLGFSFLGQFKVDEKTYPVIKIIDIDEVNDYELTYASVKIARIVMPLGDYNTYIYPNREKLEFILKTERLDYNSRLIGDQEGSVDVTTYMVSLLPGARPYQSEDNNSETIGREVQNLTDLAVIDIQLKDPLVDSISKTTVGGHFIDTTNADLLKNLITMYTNGYELEDSQKLLGVDIHAAASEIVKKSVIIPHNSGVLLSDLADYLQVKTGGVFASGMAQFIQDRHWYVYPPYDTSGFDESIEKIIIVSIPAKRYPQVNKTYLTENGVTTILSTGNKKITSDKQAIQDNAGNGVMFADANNMMAGFSEQRGNVALVQPKKNINSYVGEERSNGKNNVRMSPEAITSNPYHATSRMARSQGHFYTVEWENADPTKVKPGLNVKIQYLNENEVCYIEGVLLKSHIQIKMNGTGLLATGYRCFVVMQVFVKADGTNAGLIGLG